MREENSALCSLNCLGADVVNLGGHSKEGQKGDQANDFRVPAGCDRFR